MRYVFISIFVVVCLLALTACNKIIPINRHGDGKLIIEFTDSPQELANYEYSIKIYDNCVVEYGNNQDGFKTKNISESVYDEIISYAFSKNVLNLDGKNISNPNVLDGYWTYINLYKEDGSVVRIGGSNPMNKYFDKLEGMIKDITVD